METGQEAEITVSHLDISRFLGDWYLIANIPTFMERGATNAIETFSWNEKEQRLDLYFRFRKDSPQGDLKEHPQKIWIQNPKTNAEWRVQPWWPLKFSYLVLDLAEDYSHVVIGGPQRNHLWILSRTKSLPPAIYQKILYRVQQLGYDLSQIQKIPQVWN